MNDNVERRWVRAKEALQMVGRNSAGVPIVDWAAENIVAARCRRLTDHEPGVDGYVYMDASFWEKLKSYPGSLYRDWSAGTFTLLYKTNMRDRSREMKALGVEFDALQIENMGGALVAPAISAPSPSGLAGSGLSPRKRGGGAPMDNHAGPATAVTLSLLKLAQEKPEEVQKITIPSIESMLEVEYKRLSNAVPAGKNLTKQANGLWKILQPSLTAEERN